MPILETDNIGICLKRKLRVERLGIARFRTSVSAFGLKFARLFGISEIGLEILLPKESFQLLVSDRCQNLDPTVEVSRHPVGAADINFAMTAVLEIVDAAVFEKSPDDASHPDILGHAWDARSKRADAADDKIDLDARARRVVESIYDLKVGKPVELRCDPGR